MNYADHAKTAFDSAMLIGKRIPAAERYIINHPRYSYSYALFIVKARWPECESGVLMDPEWSLLYSRDILKRPWPEAEEIIKTVPECCYRYAKEVLKRRWLEAEDIIKKSLSATCDYLSYVVEDHLPEMEKVLKLEGGINFHWKYYLSTLSKLSNIRGKKWHWLKQGISADLLDLLNGLGMDLEMQNYII